MIGFLISTAAAAALTTLGYNSMAPRSQLFGPTFIGNGAGSRQIALTFDDGPNDPHTLRLLDVLDKHGVKATFFMIGRHVALKPKVAEAVARAEHVIGNHTFTHPNLIFCSRTQLQLQVAECERALDDTVGAHSRLFRPPHGGRRPDVLTTVRRLGFTPIMWSATGYDWSANDAGEIVANVVRQIQGGDVLLLHDGGHVDMGIDRTATIAATDQLIRRYRDEGYEFVTVEQMMNGAG
ncbi:MAG: polysaccharide deacetylase family protein [Terriglobales bacterium]